MLFEVGDKVKRTEGSWLGMNKGDIGTVTKVRPDDGSVQLAEYGTPVSGSGVVWYDDGKLELVCRYPPPGPADEHPPIGISRNTVGRKDDSGKLDMTLFDDMPRALEAVCEVMQWAITKKEPVPYQRGSWLGVHPDRYRAAIGRHTSASAKQASQDGLEARYQRDAETHLLHLAHVACSALFALESTLRELDNNPKA